MVQGLCGRCLLMQARLTDAEREVRAAYDAVVAGLGAKHWRATTLADRMVEVLTAEGRADEAAQWRPRGATCAPATKPSSAPGERAGYGT